MRRVTLMIVSTLAAVIMLFSYRTSTRATNATADPAAAPAGIVTGPAPTPDVTAQKGSHPTRKTSPKPTTITVNGPTEQTRYGPVQVQLTIAGKRITSIKTLQHPSGDDRSIQIAADALPQLRSETLTAQSAHIDAVSGATYTSQGFQHSLQRALDLAHFG